MGHKGAHDDLTATEVRELFDYSPVTGVLTWKVSLSRRVRVGAAAGFVNISSAGPRLKVGIHGQQYMVHRIIWLWMKGRWPRYEVDHENRDGLDNRWDNLRRATPSQNGINRRLQSNSTTGFKGVCLPTAKRRYTAHIKIRGKHRHLGCFDTAEEAAACYAEAAKELHGEFADVDTFASSSVHTGLPSFPVGPPR